MYRKETNKKKKKQIYVCVCVHTLVRYVGIINTLLYKIINDIFTVPRIIVRRMHLYGITPMRGKVVGRHRIVGT